MNVQNNKSQLFWAGNYMEILLVLNIISIGSFFIIAVFLNPEHLIKWCTITEIWLLCAYIVHRVAQQPKNNF
jgi:hypothetical protein